MTVTFSFESEKILHAVCPSVLICGSPRKTSVIKSEPRRPSSRHRQATDGRTTDVECSNGALPLGGRESSPHQEAAAKPQQSRSNPKPQPAPTDRLLKVKIGVMDRRRTLLLNFKESAVRTVKREGNEKKNMNDVSTPNGRRTDAERTQRRAGGGKTSYIFSNG